MSDEKNRAFVQEHTALAPVPLLPDIQLYTATDLLPLWRATESWLSERGLAVPYWCVPWAGGQALAHYILSNPAVVAGKKVIDFATGSGVVAIAAAQAGARHVRAVDIDPIAIAACDLNVEANRVADKVLIVCKDIVGSDIVGDDYVVLAGDTWYEKTPSAQFESWFRALVKNDVRVLTGDPLRTYAPRQGVNHLATYVVPTTVDLESASSRRVNILEIRSA